VNAVSPGATQTDMLDILLSANEKNALCQKIPLGRFAMPDEVANLVLFLCSNLNTYITGQNIVIDGGATII
jgi:3-oxoacyl-[acyl-carrier protein] reductase